MELAAVLILWPFIILAFSLVFIAFSDLSIGGFWIFFLVLIAMFTLLVRDNNKKSKTGPVSMIQELENLRRLIITFSIGLLIPVFIRYVFEAFNQGLVAMMVGLVVGFGLTIWGMFIHSNKVVMYSSILGGALSILYIYIQLWDLGGLPRVIAAAFGLIVAVTISTIKLKDKLS